MNVIMLRRIASLGRPAFYYSEGASDIGSIRSNSF